MMPREDGRHGRRRPLDQILNPQLPTSPATPATGGVGTTGGITSPVDEVLADDGGNGGGETNPWVNPFMEVYEATKTGALKNLGDIQKQMSEGFAHRGGYFGGKHAIAQADVASKTGTFLDKLLAETSLGASERQYEDWKRGRGEIMGLLNLIPTLLGTESFENIVSQPGQGKGGALGSLAGAGAGSVLGPMGATIGSETGSRIKGG